MDIVNILIIASAVIIIVVLWYIVVSRHFKSKYHAIENQWEHSEESLRKRHSLLPNLIETLRIYDKNQELFIDSIIEIRIKAAKENFLSAKKIEYEHNLSNFINKIFGIAGTNDDLRSDTNYLELKTEIIDLNHNINEKINKFNKMVRSYNKDIKKTYLKPIASLKKYKNINIFEFEM